MEKSISNGEGKAFLKLKDQHGSQRVCNKARSKGRTLGGADLCHPKEVGGGEGREASAGALLQS